MRVMQFYSGGICQVQWCRICSTAFVNGWLCEQCNETDQWNEPALGRRRQTDVQEEQNKERRERRLGKGAEREERRCEEGSEPRPAPQHMEPLEAWKGKMSRNDNYNNVVPRRWYTRNVFRQCAAPPTFMTYNTFSIFFFRSLQLESNSALVLQANYPTTVFPFNKSRASHTL